MDFGEEPVGCYGFSEHQYVSVTTIYTRDPFEN